MTDSPFIFFTCQVGAEAALKQELSLKQPGLRFSFSRPGFLTFRDSDNRPISPKLELELVLARTYGVSIGNTDGDLNFVLRTVEKMSAGQKVHLHFWIRDMHAPRKWPMGYVPGKIDEPLHTNLTDFSKNAAFFPQEKEPKEGELVFDLILLENDKWWLGYHEHSSFHSPYPGARPIIEVPEEAPSRAYLKLEEAILYSGVPLKSGDVALEIGSAPGGACYSLLKRGLRVYGVDPKPMDTVVKDHLCFVHLKKPVQRLSARELPEGVEWLLLDMNLSPDDSLKELEWIIKFYQDSMLGILFTLKLTDLKYLDLLPAFMTDLKKLGLARFSVKQLTNGGCEVFLGGLTKKGLKRI